MPEENSSQTKPTPKERRYAYIELRTHLITKILSGKLIFDDGEYEVVRFWIDNEYAEPTLNVVLYNKNFPVLGENGSVPHIGFRIEKEIIQIGDNPERY